MKGAGAYDAARRAFSGTWKGYPPKQVVKYLGAHIQSNGSLQSEVRKRTASARLGFAKFARFFKRSTVPFSRKVLVFKAVVNGALLSGLEVRPLSPMVFCFVGSLGNMASVLLLVKIPIVLFLLPLFVNGLPYPRLSLSYVLVVCCGFDRLLKPKLMVKLDWNLLLSLADLRL